MRSQHVWITTQPTPISTSSLTSRCIDRPLLSTAALTRRLPGTGDVVRCQRVGGRGRKRFRKPCDGVFPFFRRVSDAIERQLVGEHELVPLARAAALQPTITSGSAVLLVLRLLHLPSSSDARCCCCCCCCCCPAEAVSARTFRRGRVRSWRGRCRRGLPRAPPQVHLRQQQRAHCQRSRRRRVLQPIYGQQSRVHCSRSLRHRHHRAAALQAAADCHCGAGLCPVRRASAAGVHPAASPAALSVLHAGHHHVARSSARGCVRLRQVAAHPGHGESARLLLSFH